MIEKDHSKLSIRRQCELLGVNRNRLKPPIEPITDTERDIMRALDELHLRWPFYGQRKLLVELRKLGWEIGRKRIRRLMKIMGIEAIAPKPPLSTPAPGHKIYPYLLRNRKITKPNEVWCSDITYVPMAKGHCYLVAIMDWHSRAVLAWEVSNTMDTGFCVRAFKRAIKQTGVVPEIFNTDQGSQFTSEEWTDELKSHPIKISMDGKGRWMDKSGATPGLYRAPLAEPQI